MITKRFYLKERFPELGENGSDAYVECYIPSALENAGESLKRKKHPCMVVVPGGGYRLTSDREAEPIALQFMAEGYRAFVIRYSCAPHCFPQQLREVAAVMELIYEHADEWNIEVSRTAIIGFSAGGHLATQYSNLYNCPEVRAIFPDSKPVQACILGYTVITDHPDYKHAGSVQNYLGQEKAERNEKGFDCASIVSEQTPPTFIWHTVEDKTVPVQNSLLYAKALSDHKIPYEMHIYPCGEHGLSVVNETVFMEARDARVMRAQKWIADAKTWLKMIGV